MHPFSNAAAAHLGILRYTLAHAQNIMHKNIILCTKTQDVANRHALLHLDVALAFALQHEAVQHLLHAPAHGVSS